MGNSSSRPNLLLIIIACLAGLFLMYLAVINSMTALETKKWPTTTGIITVSEITGISKYTPRISYTYTIDSTVYSSDKIRLTSYTTQGKKQWATKVTDKYPLNSKVTVYYNPNKVEESLLEPGIKIESVLMFLIGLIIFAAPLIGYIYEVQKSMYRDLNS